MSARKTRRISALRKDKQLLYEELMVLVNEPDSDLAATIRMKHKMLNQFREDILNKIWFGTYSKP
jgi:hypothetical protein